MAHIIPTPPSTPGGGDDDENTQDVTNQQPNNSEEGIYLKVSESLGYVLHLIHDEPGDNQVVASKRNTP
jgi:hypothetical protein